MKEAAELETQKKIYMLISKEPGLNLTKISELLNINVPLTIYHLRYLEKHELITVIKEKGYTRCYAKGQVGIRDKKILSLLRQEIPLKIVLFLLKHHHAKHKEILEQFNIAKSTLSYHLKKLLSCGVLQVISVENEQWYAVVHEKEILSCLIKYKPSRIAFGLNDTWADFTVHKKQKNSGRGRIRTHDSN